MTSTTPSAISNGSRPVPSAVVPAEQPSMTETTGQRSQWTPLERKLISEIKQKELEIHEIRHQWDQETWKSLQLEKNQNSIAQALRRENTHLEIARDERRKAGKNPLEDVLYLKNEEIWKLCKRVKDMEKLATFTRCDGTETLISWNEVTSAIDMLSSELELILPGHDQRKPLLIPDVVEGSELARLIRCILGNETDAVKEKQALRCWVSRYDPEVVLRSLIVAAVKDWVFMSQFPTLNPNHSPLLEAYREIVQTYGKSKFTRPLSLKADTDYSPRWLEEFAKSRFGSTSQAGKQ